MICKKSGECKNMSSKSDKDIVELPELKKRIRSLLISVKEGLTVQELENDYIEFFGEKLPFVDHGFSSHRAFLESQKDVVRFVRDEYGFEKIKQVSDESTKHIEQLVARQRSDPKRKKGAKRRPPTARGGDVSSSRGRRGGWSAGRGGRTFHNSHHTEFPVFNQQTNIPPRGRPPLLTTPRRESLLGTPGCAGGTVNSAVPRRFQRLQNSFEYRKQTSADFLKNREESSLCSLLSTSQIQTCRFNSAHQKQNVSSWETKLSNGYWSDDDEQKTLGNTSRSPDRLSDLTDNENSREKEDDSAHAVPEDTCEINKTVQDRVQKVLLKAPKGLWANRLPVMYRQMFREDLPMREYGCHSVIEFVTAMPHLVRVERPYEKGDWLLSDATCPKEEADSPVKVQQKQGTVSKPAKQKGKQRPRKQVSSKEMNILKESVRQVLQAHVDGVPLSLFKDVYQDMTGKVLDPEQYGEPDIDCLLEFLAEQGVFSKKDDGSNSRSSESVRLHALPGQGPRCFDLLLDTYKPHTYKIKESAETKSGKSYTDDFVLPGMIYPPASFDSFKTGQSYEIHVSNVINPSLFWVQKRETIADLDDLMDELHNLYTRCGDFYQMPEELMVHGQVCACLYPGDGNWHRGIITSSDKIKVQVYFVDYGNTCPIKKNNIRYLKQPFLSLPVQAIQAKLAFLRPPGDQKTFSEEIQAAMLNFVRERPLRAVVSEVQDLVLSLVLVDTSGNTDVNINDELVDLGHARFADKEELRKDGVLANWDSVHAALHQLGLPHKGGFDASKPVHDPSAPARS